MKKAISSFLKLISMSFIYVNLIKASFFLHSSKNYQKINFCAVMFHLLWKIKILFNQVKFNIMLTNRTAKLTIA